MIRDDFKSITADLNGEKHLSCCGGGYSNTTGDPTLPSDAPSLDSLAALANAGSTAQPSSKSGGGGNVSQGEIQQGLADVGGVLNLLNNRPKTALTNVCGRKPLFGKAKKAAYDACEKQFTATLVNAQNQQNQQKTSSAGMTPGEKWALGIGLTALFGIGIFVVVKVAKGKTAVASAPAVATT
jgi:hypothetical protein